MIALLDGDIFSYRAAASAENDPVEVAVWRCRDSIELCLNAVNASEYFVFLSDKKENNFRYAIYPEYKANRTQPRPKHLVAVNQYLINEWQANVATNQEADDALGIMQMEKCRFDADEPTELLTTICSIDKDLLMIPGLHFNFVKSEFQEISPIEGLKNFYKQLLIGDRADNIFGVDGIGKVKAGRRIDPLETEAECFDVVRNLYDDDKRLLMNGKVLWIRRKQQEQWEFPIVDEQNDVQNP